MGQSGIRFEVHPNSLDHAADVPSRPYRTIQSLAAGSRQAKEVDQHCRRIDLHSRIGYRNRAYYLRLRVYRQSDRRKIS